MRVQASLSILGLLSVAAGEPTAQSFAFRAGLESSAIAATRGGLAETVASSATRDPVLDLSVRGVPQEGRTLRIEARGPASTAFVILASVQPGPLESTARLPGVIPGSRAASAETRERARRAGRPTVLGGVFDEDGLWSHDFTARAAGTRLFLRGIAGEAGEMREFEALELDILPAPGPGVAGATVLPPPSPVSPGQGVRPCYAREDLPDLGFEDSNCDGIDGDVSRAVFVAIGGSAGNPGTMSMPLDDINAAIQMADLDPTKDHVYVSEGVYFGRVDLLPGVSIWGGYSALNGWQRSPAFVTTLHSGDLIPNGRAGIYGVNLGLSNADSITLGSLTVLTDAAPMNGHNYGVYLLNSVARLEAVNVLAGPGGAASSGATGANGAPGSPGANGSTNGAGTDQGGNGGGGGHSGGRGGNGGNVTLTGDDGSHGSNVGAIIGGLWISNGDGLTGGTGGSGSGGGGGGGGAVSPFPDFFQGGAGGGGGGGGFGGQGGTGGRCGGSSFALFLANSDVSLESCELTAGAGQNGNNGGGRGSGSGGGAGGFGVNYGDPALDGGRGGTGGSGGQGGLGGGGGGGHSYAIVLDAPSAILSVADTTLAVSAAGVGGIGGSTGVSGEAVLIKQL